MVPDERFELPTNGLQNRCSTTELIRQKPSSHGHFWRLPNRRYRPFATALLPNALAALLLYGDLQRIVNERGAVCLHVRQHVRGSIEGDADLAVAQALAGDLGMHARGQQVRCMGVAKIVEADTGEGAVVGKETHPLLA